MTCYLYFFYMGEIDYMMVQPCRFIEIQNQRRWFAVIFASGGCTANAMASGLLLPLFINRINKAIFTMLTCVRLQASEY